MRNGDGRLFGRRGLAGAAGARREGLLGEAGRREEWRGSRDIILYLRIYEIPIYII